MASRMRTDPDDPPAVVRERQPDQDRLALATHSFFFARAIFAEPGAKQPLIIRSRAASDQRSTRSRRGDQVDAVTWSPSVGARRRHASPHHAMPSSPRANGYRRRCCRRSPYVSDSARCARGGLELIPAKAKWQELITRTSSSPCMKWPCPTATVKSNCGCLRDFS